MQHKLPPAWLRLSAAFFRQIPSIRGRGRAEAVLGQYLCGQGWTDKLQINGYSLDLVLDDLISRTIYLNGSFDKSSTAAMQALLHPGAIVFDGGANMGYYTLLFASMVSGSGKVYAFEPVPATAARLQCNLA